LSTLFLILRDLREEQMVLLELEEGLHLIDEDFWELGKTLQIFMPDREINRLRYINIETRKTS
jgi:hypothetical protein